MSTAEAPVAVCCFCHASSLPADPSVRLVPVSLRYRAFAHGPCLSAHRALPCSWCTAAPWSVGAKVLASVPWEGNQQNFPAEVIAVETVEPPNMAAKASKAFARDSAVTSASSDGKGSSLTPEEGSAKEETEVFLTLSFANSAKLADVAASYPDMASLQAPLPVVKGNAAATAQVQGIALYERGLAYAFGLSGGLPHENNRDRNKAVELWKAAAARGHPIASMCVRVPKACVAPQCLFHQSPHVEAWWRLLPDTVIRDALDVRPEEVLDGSVGGSLTDAAAAPDPIGRAHAAADALLGAFGATLRGLHAPANPGGVAPISSESSANSSSSTSGSSSATATATTSGSNPEGSKGSKRPAENNANISATANSESSDSSTSKEEVEVKRWLSFLRAHLSAFDRCVAELPGIDHSRANQEERLESLQGKLAAKREELSQALRSAKAQKTENRWAASAASQAEHT